MRGLVAIKSARWLRDADDENPLTLHDDSEIPYRILRATSGLEMPTFEFQTYQTPGVDGVTMGSVVTASRDEVRLPIFMWAEDRVQMRRLKSGLAVAMNPKRGPGLLELSESVGTDSGVVRRLSAVYRGGLEGDGSDMGGRWWAFTLRFQALDPYWYSADPLRATWQGLPATPFFPFSFPFTLSRSGVEVVEPLEVTGDADTWPSFDLYGPFTKVRVRPDSDLKQTFWEINRNTSATEMLRLVTKPGEESLQIFDNPLGRFGFPIRRASPNVWSCLDAHSWFSPLGFNEQLVIDVEGTSEETLIELTASEAWFLPS